ncbi:MAG: penicillin acylase family protein [Desulfobacteraceae bacterium]|nr:penicillin acylase family protein [Desulfobacteraceae bacterium]
MKQIKKAVFLFILTIGLIGFLIGGGAWFYLSGLLPDLDGIVLTENVSGETKIIRDQWGIPHINAGNGEDAHFALGFTIAQDRLFQMELQRRLARGELSEILGESLLKVDKMFRTYLFRRCAQDYLAEAEKINPKALEYLDAFLSGVNHFVKTGPLPVEYKLLGFEPRPFTRLDSLSIMGYVAYSFADGIKRDSLYTILEPSLTRADLDMIFPDYRLDNHVTIMELNTKQNLDSQKSDKDSVLFSDQSFTGFGESLRQALNDAAWISPPFIGSNSWVLGPSRSQNGHALMANDPHIGIANPGVWYEAHVTYPGYENYGYHLPLMPFPMLAQNGTKAWAITMFENDDMDLYAETFHPDDPTLVKSKGEWVKAEMFTETIKVKGMPDETLTIRKTPHGPVISDFIKGYKGQPVAMCWVYHQGNNPFLDSVYHMANADSLEPFQEAVSKLTAPGFNISYIDNKGNIAWWAVGSLPNRPAHVSGKKIHDGSTGKDDWLEILPFEQNPQLVNPANGMIVTANNSPTIKPVGPIPYLEGYFRPSDRAARIVELLEQKEKWTLEELKKVQIDSKTPFGPDMAKQMLQILQSEKSSLSAIETKALGLLESWDGLMGIDSVGATIFHFTAYHILYQALEKHIDSANLKAYLNQADHWSFLKRILKTPQAPIKGKRASSPPRSRQDIVLSGFKNAIKELSEKLGGQTSDWKWGAVHTVEYVHALGRKKPLNLIFNIGPFPSPCERTSINQIKSKTGSHDYKAYSIPSTRRLVDCNDPQSSWGILPTGNSGNFMSKYFDDQAQLYITNQYRKINFSRDQIQKAAAHVLTLKPE